jgi:RNA polymerase sigma-70 factor (ECF subfamily)
MSDDHAQIQAVLAGDGRAFGPLVERHQKLVWHLVYRMVQHPEDARELCQDVFLRVHRYLHQYRAESSFATWVGRIAFTVCMRHLQRKRLPLADTKDEDSTDTQLAQLDDGFDLESACADSEVMAHLGAAIECLPPLQRTLVTLYHLDELSIAEIAQITELPHGTIKNYLFRARIKLKTQLEQRLGELT